MLNFKSNKTAAQNQESKKARVPKAQKQFSVTGAVKGALREVAASGVGIATNAAVVAGTRNALGTAVWLGDFVAGKIVPQTMDVKVHKWSKTKTVTEKEALATIQKRGKGFYSAKSNRALAQPGTAQKVQTGIDCAALATGAISAVKMRKIVKHTLLDLEGAVIETPDDNVEQEAQDITEEEV